MVTTMAGTMTEILPEQAGAIATNEAALEHEIDQLAEESRAKLRGHQYTFLSYHPSWSYLADELSLHQLVVEAEGKEVGLVSAAKVLKDAERLKLSVILAEPASPPRQIEYLRSTLNASVVTIDPVCRDWFGAVRLFVDTVAAHCPAEGEEERR